MYVLNFVESEKFVMKVGSVAELEGHHPDIFFGWGYAKIKIFKLLIFQSNALSNIIDIR